MATRALRTPLILLVSQSVDTREGYARSLRTSGYGVVGAATTTLAYQIATTRPTDMVVTEAHFPGSMSGPELTRRLRIHTRTINVPVIVLSSGTRHQDAELSIKAGADIFLETPVSGDLLRQHVTRLFVARARNVFGGDNRCLGDEHSCPECGGTLEYRQKAPILMVSKANAREPQERLRYGSGWFCSNAWCEYQELGEGTD